MSKTTRNAIFAFQAIKAYAKAVKTPIKESEVLLTDLLADLRYWADSKGLDFDNCNYMAEDHYRVESGPSGNCAKCGRALGRKKIESESEDGGIFYYCSRTCEESH